jgi:hypothetical protein
LPVFSGTAERKAKGVHDANQVVLSATQDLMTLDSTQGLHMPGVFTLLPREYVMAHHKRRGLQGVYNAMIFLEQKNSKRATKRSKKRKVFQETSGDGSTYVCTGVGCDHTSDAGLSQHLKGLDQDPKHHKTIGKFLRNVEGQSSAWLDHESLVFLQAVKKATGHPGFDCGGNGYHRQQPLSLSVSPNISSSSPSVSPKISSTIFPAIACGRNVYLNVHTDDDYFWSATTIIQNDAGPLQEDSAILNYFCFPTKGISVALRHGDILLFNPTVPHCISSRCDETRDVFCISLYLKTAVVGGNDNKEFRRGAQVKKNHDKSEAAAISLKDVDETAEQRRRPMPAQKTQKAKMI